MSKLSLIIMMLLVHCTFWIDFEFKLIIW